MFHLIRRVHWLRIHHRRIAGMRSMRHIRVPLYPAQHARHHRRLLTARHLLLILFQRFSRRPRHRLMQRQQDISQKRLKRKVGTRERVIIDEVGPTVAKGRTRGDAPQIDGGVFVASKRPLRVGEIATVKIERAEAYDLHGTVVGY